MSWCAYCRTAAASASRFHACRGVGAEEQLPHVVVDADDEVAALAVEIDSFGADETGRAGDDNHGHGASITAAQERIVRMMLIRKLASSVWTPMAVSMTPGTTMRMVLT